MRKRTMQLCRKDEVRIYGGYPARPQLRHLGLDVPVKRGVDLDHVEALRHVVQGMLLAYAHARRIEHTLPVLVRPAGGTNANLVFRAHGTKDGRVAYQKVST